MKPRIMLLEDDIELRDYLANSFMDKGFEVMRVSQPDQALTLLEMAAIDLAIIDGGLPGMDGIAVIKEAIENGFQGKFIFMSANPSSFITDEERVFMHERLHITRIFQKPVSFNQLAGYIEELLKGELADLLQFASDDDLTAVSPMNYPTPNESPQTDLRALATKLGYTKSETVPELALRDSPSTPIAALPAPTTLPTQPSPFDISSLAPFPSNYEVPPPQEYAESTDDHTKLECRVSQENGFSVDDIDVVDIQVVETKSKELKAFAPPHESSIGTPLPLKTQLQQLQEEYSKKLEIRIYDLLRLLAPIRQKKDRKALEEAIVLSHKLHGSAGTFGFQEVSNITGWIEDILLGLKDQPGNLPPRVWEEVYFRVERALLHQKEV